ncbi:MAG TPA: TlpA disulfide reductase family protein [Acidimicrobiales bacterium]|nr:TlpA disulfide reductase family protein [Acidimicrobiales bacterium]
MKRAAIAGAVLLSVVVVLAVLLTRSSSPATHAAGVAPRPAPAITAADVRDGAPGVDLAMVRAGRPAVVNFFASWCVPCRQELPVLAQASAAHTDIAFIGVDFQDSRSNAADILARYGITYPAAYDPKGDIGTSYGIRGLPATAFLDAKGRITELHLGALTAPDLDHRLTRLVPTR